jgi:hypothetical protein
MGSANSLLKESDLSINRLSVDMIAEYISHLSPQPTYELYREIFINNKVDGKKLSEVEDDEMIPFLDSIGVTDVVHQTIIAMEINKFKTRMKPFDHQFSRDGVRLKVFTDLIDQMGGRSTVGTMTTSDVGKSFIKTSTSSASSSYCQHVKRHNHNDVGEATVYICHAWSYLFVDVVDALRNHFQDAPDTYIWFDLFCVNQHIFKAIDHDHTWWGNTLQSLIESIGYTVMIVSSSSNLIPLKRTWCLYELYCTIVTNSRFEVAMSGSNSEVFMKSIAIDSGDLLTHVSYQQSLL